MSCYEYSKAAVEFVQQMVDRLRSRATIFNKTDNLDGTWTLEVTSVLDLQANQYFIASDDVQYQVISVDDNTSEIVVNADVPLGDFKTSAPYLFHGNPIRMQQEIGAKHDIKAKFPAIWLLEPFDEVTNLMPMERIGTVAALRMMFVDSSNPRDWDNEDQRVNVLQPMRVLMQQFVTLVKNSPNVVRTALTDYRAEEKVNFGLFIADRGNERLIINEDVSGLLLEMDVPLTKYFCQCAESGEFPEPILCAPVVVNLNESQYFTLQSGEIRGFEIVDQNGDLTGSWDGDKWVVTGGGICLPATVELNGIEVANPASGATVDIPVIQDGNPVGSWNGTEWVVPACAPCATATWELENTDGTNLDSGTIPSGGSDTIIAPDADVYIRKSNNLLIAALSAPSGANSDYNVADSPVNVNGALFEAVPATETLNISVRKSTGNDEIGSKQGQFWRIPDSHVTVNNVPFADVKATEALDVPVQYRNNNTAGKIESGVVRIPQCGVIGKTGQTTSYAANDDGARQVGEGVDFLTLEEVNAFGNTNRFTDTLGGQTYANNIVLDHLYASCKKRIIPGYFRTAQSAAPWATVMGLQPFALGGFSNWYVPNDLQLSLIVQRNGNGLNYSPFNLTVALWSSTTNNVNTAQAYGYSLGALYVGNLGNKTNSQAYIAFRYFTYAELGL